MKINLWGINYHPEPIGIAVYSTAMCEYLQSKGHEVSVTTGFPYYPSWTSQADRLYSTETINGVKVYRNWVYVPSPVTVIKRIFHEFSFVFISMLRQLFLPAPDVYIIVSPPLLLGVAAWFVSTLKGVPFIFHVQDLQPDAAVNLGMIKQGFLVKALLAMESFAYRKANLITVIGREMQEVLTKKGVPIEKIQVVPNTVEMFSADNLPKHGTWRQQHGIQESSAVVSYCGNLGVKQGLEIIIDAARTLDGNYPIQFVICGDGSQKDKISNIIRQEKLTNIKLLGLLEEESYHSLLVDSHFCLVTLKPGTGASFLPSKLLTILAIGKPVITNADPGSALHNAVKEGGFGLTVTGNGKELAQALIENCNRIDLLQQMSEAGLHYVQRFEKDIVLAEFERLVTSTTQPCRSSQQT